MLIGTGATQEIAFFAVLRCVNWHDNFLFLNVLLPSFLTGEVKPRKYMCTSVQVSLDIFC